MTSRKCKNLFPTYCSFKTITFQFASRITGFLFLMLNVAIVLFYKGGSTNGFSLICCSEDNVISV